MHHTSLGKTLTEQKTHPFKRIKEFHLDTAELQTYIFKIAH